MSEDLSAVATDRLLSEVLQRLRSAHQEQERWHLLLDAVVSMAAGLSLEDLMSQIVHSAADLADAQYVALGVLDTEHPERRLRAFVTHGLSQEQIRAIGDLPVGHGVLGLLIDDPEPLCVHDITRHPQSSGFPRNHPPMHTFLGVPVRVGAEVFGNLYLTQKRSGGDFTAQDQDIVTALAAAAGVAIENARLSEAADRRERWLDARAEITSTLMGDADRSTALQLVADRSRELSGADVAWIVSGVDRERLRVEVVSGVPVRRDDLADVVPSSSVAAQAVDAGAPMIVDDLSESGVGGVAAAAFDISGIGPAVMVPFLGSGGSDADVGVLALGWRHSRADAASQLDLQVAHSFAEQIAIAIRLAEHRDAQGLLALYDDRERIGRDLHDVVIQRLFAIGLQLQAAQRHTEAAQAAERFDEMIDAIDETIRDIRGTIFQLGSDVEAGDLQTRVTRLIARAAATLKFRPTLRLDGPVRSVVGPGLAADILAVLSEALSNVSRHAHATEVTVALSAGSHVELTVRDNGVGIPTGSRESGLANMRRRAEARGGHCTVSAMEPHGTLLQWSAPLSQDAPGPSPVS